MRTTIDLEAGRYDMIRMHMVEGLEFTNATQSETSEAFAFRVPSEKIRIPVDFDLSAGLSTIVILDIVPDTEWRTTIAGNPEHNLCPVIKPTVIASQSS